MFLAYVLVSVLLVLACGFSAVAMYMRYAPVLASLQQVGAPLSWRVPLATCKAAGAFGVLLGLLGVPVVGEAAAVGVVLYFAGAIGFHFRARVPGYGPPLVFLVLGLGSLILKLIT